MKWEVVWKFDGTPVRDRLTFESGIAWWQEIAPKGTSSEMMEKGKYTKQRAYRLETYRADFRKAAMKQLPPEILAQYILMTEGNDDV